MKITSWMAILSLSFFLSSCLHDYEDTLAQRKLFADRAAEKIDTLIVYHQSCTECLDLYIKSGTVHYPSDISSWLRDTAMRDIQVCGNFPKDLTDMTSWNHEPGCNFRITGKIIGAESDPVMGNVPLFYVETWKRAFSSGQR